jgi:fluoroacetyl-CoA thioesterase
MSEERNLKPGLKGHASLTVTDATTARALGSGNLDVFATPMMVALMERAAVDCVEGALPSTETSLGVHLDVAHSAPSPLGVKVTATAELLTVDGRKLTFRVEAHQDKTPIGEGTHRRVIVNSTQFLTNIRAAGE